MNAANVKTTQAMQVMAKAFEACAFKGDTRVGTISEGGAIYIAARAMFSDVKWDLVFQQLEFADGSAIKFIRDPSMYKTTYKAVKAGTPDAFMSLTFTAFLDC